jgi:hypothetical protein
VRPIMQRMTKVCWRPPNGESLLACCYYSLTRCARLGSCTLHKSLISTNPALVPRGCGHPSSMAKKPVSYCALYKTPQTKFSKQPSGLYKLGLSRWEPVLTTTAI